MLATYTFQRNITLLLERRRLIVAKLDAGAEIDGGAWSLSVPLRRHCNGQASARGHESSAG
jgi:hypothetical protein